MKLKRGYNFWALIITGFILVAFFIAGQTLSLISYDLAVSLGLQESISEITTIGIAWAKGFAFADTILYIPMIIFGLVGLLNGKSWGIYSMMGALAISIYWPIVSLYAIYSGRNDLNLSPDKYVSYSIILPLIAAYGIWGMVYLYKHRLEYD